MPSFSWTFQTSPVSPATTLANGSENFAIHNTFAMKNLSSLSVGTRLTIKVDWFGVYNVTATNSQGSETISFSAVAKGKPDLPKDGKVICPYQDRAILSWSPAFNGGSTQTFAVGIKIHQDDSFIIDKSLNNLNDPGPRQIINITVSGLTSDTQHFFMVYARNDFGNSTFEEEINCTTKAEPAPESSHLGPIIGGVVGSIVAIIAVIVIIIIVKAKRRKSGRKRKDDDTEMITSKKRSAVDDST
ncbi:nephrin-like, partial [Mizuhopecten yessoensis]|uniref:nephrin-like n=1 Tax=Mizuhopecten yessoensis TaxID=6573 RepID=UPI000B45B497